MTIQELIDALQAIQDDHGGGTFVEDASGTLIDTVRFNAETGAVEVTS